MHDVELSGVASGSPRRKKFAVRRVFVHARVAVTVGVELPLGESYVRAAIEGSPL
jgi:hypothetical protein